MKSPLDSKEIQPVHPKGDQSWVFIGRTDVEAETPILWPPDAKNCLIRKDPNAGDPVYQLSYNNKQCSDSSGMLAEGRLKHCSVVFFIP